MRRDAARLNDIARDRVANELARVGRVRMGAERVENGAPAAEVASKLLRRGNQAVEGCALARTSTLVVGEEEDRILLDGTAESRAELVAFQRRHFRCEEVAGLQLLVPDIFVRAAVELIGAALERGVDHRWQGIFGTHAASHDLELFQRVSRRRNGSRSQFVFSDVKAVQKPSAG